MFKEYFAYLEFLNKNRCTTSRIIIKYKCSRENKYRNIIKTNI